MNRQKLIRSTGLFIVIIVFFTSLVSLASATYYIASEQLNDADTIGTITRAHPSNTLNKFSAYAQTFKPTASGYLEAVTVSLKKVGSPVTNMRLSIEPAASASDLPNGDTLEISPTIYLASSLGTQPSTFTFLFNGSTALNSDNYYHWVFYTESTTTLDDSNLIYVMGANSNAYANGQFSGFHNITVWVTSAAQDMYFSIIANTEPAATPTPTPTPSPTPEAMPNWISDIIDAIIPIFTPLLVIFICGALGWRFAGAWGFFAGINLAIVLMYVVASQYMPLWAIIAVVVIDIGLLFGKVGFDRGN